MRKQWTLADLALCAPDLSFVTSTAFLWKTAIIVAVSSLPLYVIKFVRQRLSPPSYSKLNMT